MDDSVVALTSHVEEANMQRPFWCIVTANMKSIKIVVDDSHSLCLLSFWIVKRTSKQNIQKRSLSN